MTEMTSICLIFGMLLSASEAAKMIRSFLAYAPIGFDLSMSPLRLTLQMVKSSRRTCDR